MSTAEDELIERMRPEEARGDEHSEGFKITNEQAASWALRVVAQKRRKMAENIAVAEAEAARIQEWLRDVNAGLASDADRLEGKLIEYHAARLLEDENAKTIKLPAGTLKARRPAASVVIEDEERFLEWAKGERPEFIRTKVEVDKKAVNQAARSDGEVLPGVTVEPGEVKFTVEVSTE